MKRINLSILALLSISIFIQCAFTNPIQEDPTDPTKEMTSFRIGFYNVENLFDTKDNPEKLDDEFLPNGMKGWTEKRYQKKLNNITRVISEMGFPGIFGLCEVENADVLKDLISQKALNKKGYRFVHYDSPDIRGIDVALLYQKSQFKVIASKKERIYFPRSVAYDYTTRDILYVKGLFQGEEIHLVVNHWPSRRGGIAESESKRTFVASRVNKLIEKIKKTDANAKILLMGDFNDEPDNKSVKKTLNAKPFDSAFKAGQLYNCMSQLDEQGLGTMNYDGNWNLVDQFISSSSFRDFKQDFYIEKAGIFQRDFMMHYNKFYKEKQPSRSFGGTKYYGGYSDHLPVYVDLAVKPKKK